MDGVFGEARNFTGHPSLPRVGDLHAFCRGYEDKNAFNFHFS